MLIPYRIFRPLADHALRQRALTELLGPLGAVDFPAMAAVAFGVAVNELHDNLTLVAASLRGFARVPDFRTEKWLG